MGLSAEDVAQEVCLAAMQALPRYHDQGRPFLAFVYGIASHKVADARRAAARNRTDPTDEVPGDSRWTQDRSRWRFARIRRRGWRKLLQVLPEKQREILTLRIVVGLSAEGRPKPSAAPRRCASRSASRAGQTQVEIGATGHDYE